MKTHLYFYFQFTENDLEYALKTFDMYIKRTEEGPIPWDAITYLNAEITYGGRITG